MYDVGQSFFYNLLWLMFYIHFDYVINYNNNCVYLWFNNFLCLANHDVGHSIIITIHHDDNDDVKPKGKFDCVAS